ncbi:MAG: hypothetical protein KatS3mg115_1319 [Candidatus Poribacteria bacterium]|nr:MAG: hypothetical protein KatS3mg115_1319 [Candidatus Poribacteria bacterium]
MACEATIGNRRHRFGPTSHPTFSDAPLRVFVASEPLPTFPGWSYAETHCHSWQTSNQVEFGAPPLLLAQMAQALGLRWVLITDHSFDLAMPSDLADPLETQDRWERLGQEIEEANRSVPGVRLIRAQEVSCGSAKGTNLHLLVYALERRLPGSGDSLYGRKLIDHRPDSWLAELVEEVHAAGGLAFASHPFTAIGRMEGRLLNRSVWGQEDLSLPHLTGWEFWNTEHPGHFQAARAAWIQGLREGLRPVAIAGSDAHGDFNRSRAISLPFLRVCEAFDEAFGKPRTAVETPNGTEAELYSALREGRAVLSNGPIACIELHTERRQYPMGSAVQEESGTLIVHARSSSEFGPLRRVTLYAARIGAQEERETVLGRRLGYSAEFRVALTVRERPAYVRVEAIAEREGRTTYALTNPIWFDKR